MREVFWRKGIAWRLIVEFAPAYVVRVFGGPAKLLIDELARPSRIWLRRDAPHRVDQKKTDKRDDRKGSRVNAGSSFCPGSHLAPRFCHWDPLRCGGTVRLQAQYSAEPQVGL